MSISNAQFIWVMMLTENRGGRYIISPKAVFSSYESAMKAKDEVVVEKNLIGSDCFIVGLFPLDWLVYDKTVRKELKPA